MERYALIVLRLGLAVLFLWFGLSELLDPVSWASWVPAWATALTGMSAYTITLLNGAFEVIVGAALAFGFYTRWVALVAGLHMLLITFDIGLTAIGIRDFAIATSTLALGLFGDTPRE